MLIHERLMRAIAHKYGGRKEIEQSPCLVDTNIRHVTGTLCGGKCEQGR
jgi:hypothetical protein